MWLGEVKWCPVSSVNDDQWMDQGWFELVFVAASLSIVRGGQTVRVSNTRSSSSYILSHRCSTQFMSLNCSSIMFSTTPGCLWCSMIYLLRDIGWSPRYTLHVTQLRHVKLAVSWPRAGTRYPVSPHIHWFIVQKTTASLCPPPPSAAPSQVSELSHIILQLLIMAAHYPDIYGDDSSLQWS